MGELQLYDPLDEATESALRFSIRRFGVIYPVVVSKGPWRPGCIIDGHHRSRLAKELRIGFDQKERRVRSEEEAIEIARTLNEDRRHLMPSDQRREVVADLRQEGHSLRAIAGATGVSKAQVERDIDSLSRGGTVIKPEVIHGRDGRDQPGPGVRSAPSMRGRRSVEDVVQPPEEERLAIAFARLHVQVGRLAAEMTDLSADHIYPMLSEDDWFTVESTVNHDLPRLMSWFQGLMDCRPKPFTVVEGGRA